MSLPPASRDQKCAVVDGRNTTFSKSLDMMGSNVSRKILAGLLLIEFTWTKISMCSCVFCTAVLASVVSRHCPPPHNFTEKNGTFHNQNSSFLCQNRPRDLSRRIGEEGGKQILRLIASEVEGRE